MPLRYTAPVVVSNNVAKIVSFTYYPENPRLEVVYVTGSDATPPFVERTRTIEVINTIPAAAVTNLTALVTRLYTYLVAQGKISAGTEE